MVTLRDYIIADSEQKRLEKYKLYCKTELKIRYANTFTTTDQEHYRKP